MGKAERAAYGIKSVKKSSMKPATAGQTRPGGMSGPKAGCMSGKKGMK